MSAIICERCGAYSSPATFREVQTGVCWVCEAADQEDDA